MCQSFLQEPFWEYQPTGTIILFTRNVQPLNLQYFFQINAVHLNGIIGLPTEETNHTTIRPLEMKWTVVISLLLILVKVSRLPIYHNVC